jgi:hypothetical protein
MTITFGASSEDVAACGITAAKLILRRNHQYPDLPGRVGLDSGGRSGDHYLPSGVIAPCGVDNQTFGAL